MSYSLLREFIALMLIKEACNCATKSEDDKQGDKLLNEPDNGPVKKPKKKEQSVVSSIAGVTTPLGTGPRYPSTSPRKKCKICGKNRN